jgi:hypothetical protein
LVWGGEVDGVVTFRERRVSYAACICLRAKVLSLHQSLLKRNTKESLEYLHNRSTLVIFGDGTSLAQLLYGLIAILGPKDRKGDCRPEAARIALGPNRAPIIIPLSEDNYLNDTTPQNRKDIQELRYRKILQDE